MEFQWSPRLGQQENRAQDSRARRGERDGTPICPRRALLACLALHAPRSVALADFFSSLLETQETVVYNAKVGEAFVSLTECRWRGGLAQLGEHYVRNVGVGGSTPLPSTSFIFANGQPQ